jgi:hypothetical protein
MVVCAPCVAPIVAPTMATFFGVGATAVAARRTIDIKTKKKKDKKEKKGKKDKKDKKKSKRKSMKGGRFTKSGKIHKEFWNCYTNCYKERDRQFKKPFGISAYEWKKSLSPKEKKKYKDLQRKAKKCSEKCKDIEDRKMKEHKLKYSKEYKVINKALKENCCRCRYVKSGSSLRKVKGPYSHCSYDMENCCKDKKTIVKSKK